MIEDIGYRPVDRSQIIAVNAKLYDSIIKLAYKLHPVDENTMFSFEELSSFLLALSNLSSGELKIFIERMDKFAETIDPERGEVVKRSLRQSMNVIESILKEVEA